MFGFLTDIFGGETSGDVNDGDTVDRESWSYGQTDLENVVDAHLVGEKIGDDEDFELLVAAYMRDAHYQSRSQAIANIVYATMNAGFVALPYACYQVGVPLFIFCVVLVSCISGYTTTMVMAIATQHGIAESPSSQVPRTLEDLSEIAYGFKGYCIVAVIQILLSLTLMCMSLEVWGEIISSVASTHLEGVAMPAAWAWLLTSREGVSILGGLIVLFPVLTSTTMASLKWTSYTTFLGIVATLVAVATAFISPAIRVSSLSDIDSEEGATEALSVKSDWWVVALIITLCFSYNQKAMTVYSCLRRRNSERWKYSVVRANYLIVAIYIIFGVMGYLSHMEKLNKFNFFLDFTGSRNILFDIARSILAMSLLFTFPMDNLVASTTSRRLCRRAQKWYTGGVRKMKLAKTGKNNVDNANALLNSYKDGQAKQSLLVPLTGDAVIIDPITEESSISDSVSVNTKITSHDGSTTPERQSNQSGFNDDMDPVITDTDTGKDKDKDKDGRKDGNSNALWRDYDSGSFSGLEKIDTSSDLHEENITANSNNKLLGNKLVVGPDANSYNSYERISDISRYAESTQSDIRHSSVGDIDSHLSGEAKMGYSVFGVNIPASVLPMTFFWVVSIGISVAVRSGVAMAATMGGLCSSIMVFILPSMLYFRLGLISDYQARSIIGGIIANRAYMTFTQIAGILLFVGNVGFILLWFLDPTVGLETDNTPLS